MKQKKNGLSCLILAILAVTFVFPGLVDAAPKRLGVGAFENASQVRDSAFGSGMADMLITEFMQNKNIEMVERTRLDRLLEESGRCMTGICDASTAAEIGKTIGLEYMVFGKIVAASSSTSQSALLPGLITVSKQVKVNVRVVEVETARIILAEDAEGSKSVSVSAGSYRGPETSYTFYLEAANIAIAKAAFKIMESLGFSEGEVLMIRDKDLLINLGRDDGVKQDQRYKVIREGEVFIDRNGNVAGVDIIEIADLTITKVELTTATAKIDKIYEYKTPDGKKVKHTIQRGDIVRPIDRYTSRGFWGRK